MSTAAAAPASPAPRPRIVLSATGTAHLASCRHASKGMETWEPAMPALKASASLAIECNEPERRPCKVCKPIGRLARWERFG